MRLLLATLTLAAAALAPATADEPSTYVGECGWETVDAAPDDVYDGAVYGAVALWSPTHGNAVSATVTCEVEVNDVVVDGTTASGTGVVVVAGRSTLTLRDTDDVEFCTTVDYTSDATPTSRACEGPAHIRVPPDVHLDTFGTLARAMVDFVDPVVCPVLGGDVYLDGELWWDCPPY